MELKQLYYFTTIVQEGSISAAAKKLFMSQPPLSCQMKLLEEELKCTLFERGSRSIHLTDEGRLLYRKATDILDMSKLMKEELLSFSNKEQGIIRIGIVSSVVSSYGIKWISDFSTRYPDISYEIYEADTYKLLKKLSDCSIHFAILRTPYTNDTYKSISLINEPVVAIGDRSFFNNSEPVTLNELAAFPLITYRRWERIITSMFKKMDILYHFVCINDDARTTAQFVANKIGIGIVPKSTIKNFEKNIICKTISDFIIDSDIELLYNPACYIPPCGKLFLDYISSLKIH
mgnify:FL=1